MAPLGLVFLASPSHQIWRPNTDMYSKPMTTWILKRYWKMLTILSLTLSWFGLRFWVWKSTLTQDFTKLRVKVDVQAQNRSSKPRHKVEVNIIYTQYRLTNQSSVSNTCLYSDAIFDGRGTLETPTLRLWVWSSTLT